MSTFWSELLLPRSIFLHLLSYILEIISPVCMLVLPLLMPASSYILHFRHLPHFLELMTHFTWRGRFWRLIIITHTNETSCFYLEFRKINFNGNNMHGKWEMQGLFRRFNLGPSTWIAFLYPSTAKTYVQKKPPIILPACFLSKQLICSTVMWHNFKF